MSVTNTRATGAARVGRVSALSLLAVTLLAGGLASAASTNIYSTAFEPGESYDARYELVGQRGWVTDHSGNGGNGIITNFYGSWAAYVGLFDLSTKAEFLNVWYPINFTPPNTNRYVVRFSTVMAVFDSTTTNRDNFYWSVYNQQGARLFTLDFDNTDLGIYYILDDNSPWMDTGWSFENDAAYDLEIVMNFASNRWSALLGGEIIVSEELITRPAIGAARNLGDVDAVWAITDTDRPGDNFMVFDDYRITGELLPPPAPPAPLLEPIGRFVDGRFLLRVHGQDGARFAVEGSTNLASWKALKTNTISGGSFDFLDTGSGPLNRRFYRARWVP
jgi:hypothetical protein